MKTETFGGRLSKTTGSEAKPASRGNGLASSVAVLQLLRVEAPQPWPKEGKKGRGRLRRTRGPLGGHFCATDPLSPAEVETAVVSEMSV